MADGSTLGWLEGTEEGSSDGAEEGSSDGAEVGLPVGEAARKKWTWQGKPKTFCCVKIIMSDKSRLHVQTG